MRHLWGPVRDDDGLTFRLWAPRAQQVDLLVDGQAQPMHKGDLDIWQARSHATPGARYLFRVDGTDMPDPASRLQAGGVNDASVVTDPPMPQEWAGRPLVRGGHLSAACRLLHPRGHVLCRR